MLVLSLPTAIPASGSSLPLYVRSPAFMSNLYGVPRNSAVALVNCAFGSDDFDAVALAAEADGLADPPLSLSPHAAAKATDAVATKPISTILTSFTPAPLPGHLPRWGTLAWGSDTFESRGSRRPNNRQY